MNTTPPPQSPGSHDPFSTLGLPVRVPVDQAALRSAWLRRSAALHPDRAEDPHAAAAELARVNDAKARLGTTHGAAAEYIAAVAPELAASKDMPADMPMRMLEIREELEATTASGDASAAKALHDQATADIERTANEALALLANETTDPGALRDARTLLNAIPAYRRVITPLRDAGLAPA